MFSPVSSDADETTRLPGYSREVRGRPSGIVRAFRAFRAGLQGPPGSSDFRHFPKEIGSKQHPPVFSGLRMRDGLQSLQALKAGLKALDNTLHSRLVSGSVDTNLQGRNACFPLFRAMPAKPPVFPAIAGTTGAGLQGSSGMKTPEVNPSGIFRNEDS